MRVALAGKGGAGKTTTAATLARLLARGGDPVVAVDADSNPNLALALGLDRERARAVASLPPELVSRRLDGHRLTEPLETVLDRYATDGPDGVRVLAMGMPAHAEEGCLCAAHATVSALLGDLGDRPDWQTVVDLEASPEHLSRGTARHADVLLLIAEPYYRALEAVRRLARLAAELPIPRVAVVANKLRTTADADAVAQFCDRHDLELAGGIPWSDAVVAADGAGVPLIEDDPDGDVVAAVGRLARWTAGRPTNGS
ncbi:carbon monoxide dehydrogenase accessory protein CooC [soil metagenome]|jgi:CO dehydrogenase maturation factor|nr:P-loop NTPase [Euzebyaceae bacterium]